MKPTVYARRGALLLSTLLLGAGTATADNGGFCSTANGAGRWGYAITGYNTTGGPDAMVGSGVVDPWGKVSFSQTEVTNGQAIKGELKGRVTVSRDCKASLEVDLIVDGSTVVTATWALVYTDNQKEIRGILTALDKLPPGGTLPVQTLSAKMVSPGRY